MQGTLMINTVNATVMHRAQASVTMKFKCLPPCL